jgi:hypothetical protein
MKWPHENVEFRVTHFYDRINYQINRAAFCWSARFFAMNFSSFFTPLSLFIKKKYANESDDWCCGFICVNFEGLF